MSRAAKQGIIIKTGSALERLAMARTIAFDKTGTLTQGALQVASIQTYHSFKRDYVLGLAATVEQQSNHVLAQAIVEKASESKVKMYKARGVRESAGNGLAAKADGKDVLVGRLSLLQKADITLPKAFDGKKLQATAAFIAIDGKLAGVITFTDELRGETKHTLERLHALGVHKLLMITGDHKSTAKLIAKQLGIKHYIAEAMPGDKILALEKLDENERPVAFVGDGVNDAPVLTASDVGIALGARGSTAASESADIVIMLDDLGHVATGVDIAKRTFFIARQSILLGIGMSIALMLIFATGRFKPVYGAAIQELVDVVVIFNALRAHRG
jgi:P-type E1-E2 ATPase